MLEGDHREGPGGVGPGIKTFLWWVLDAMRNSPTELGNPEDSGSRSLVRAVPMQQACKPAAPARGKLGAPCSHDGCHHSLMTLFQVKDFGYCNGTSLQIIDSGNGPFVRRASLTSPSELLP